MKSGTLNLKIVALLSVSMGMPIASPKAQSSRLFSVQISGAGLLADQSIIPGGEAQIRLTANRLSIGAGYQVFRRDGASTGVVFLEPRYRFTSGKRLATYGAGRIGLVGQAATVIFGGGGGVLGRLSKTTVLDVGAQLYSVDARTSVTQLRVGLSIGL